MFTKHVVCRQRLSDVRIVDPDVPLGVSAPTTESGAYCVPTDSPAPAVLIPPPEHRDEPPLGQAPESGERWAEVDAFFESIEERLQEIEDRRRQALGELQQLAVELAVSIASRLVHDTIDADAFAVDKMVEQMLARFEDTEPTEIRLHPADLQLLKRSVEGKTPPWSNHSSYRLVADTKLGRGDCRIESGDLGMLSQVDLQISEIRNQLLESLEDAQIERRRPQTRDKSLRRFPDRRDTA